MLLSHTLGDSGDVFSLNSNFSEALGDLIEDWIPYDAFVAMDYHLDWIQMALYWADNQRSSGGIVRNDGLVHANQEDVDLLVAFEDEDKGQTHLVLIEAKADTGWSNEQLLSKAHRLKDIFDENALTFVTPHFVLMSPDRPERVATDEWPRWMTAAGNSSALWMELPLADGLLKVTQCDRDGNDAAGGGWISLSERQGGRWIKVNFP